MIMEQFKVGDVVEIVELHFSGLDKKWGFDVGQQHKVVRIYNGDVYIHCEKSTYDWFFEPHQLKLISRGGKNG